MKRYSRKRRNKKSYKKQYQRGGNFNEEETARLKDKLRSLRIRDGSELTEEEINEIVDELGTVSQQFSGDNFEQLLYQIQNDDIAEIIFNNKDHFKDWVKQNVYHFEIDVETDVDTTTPDDNDDLDLEVEDVNLDNNINVVNDNLEGGKKKKKKKKTKKTKRRKSKKNKKSRKR